MPLDHKTRAALDQFMVLVRARYPVEQAILFGSRARGDHHDESDADVAVVLNMPPQRKMPLALELSNIAVEVLLETGIVISPIPIWQSHWDKPSAATNPILLANIQKEGIVL